MIPVSLINKQAKEVYAEVFVGHSSQRNEGKVALCCGVFFSRTKLPNYTEHAEVVSLAEFKRRTGVKTEQEFVLWARNKTPKFGPRINAQECSKSPKPTPIQTQILELQQELSETDKRIKQEAAFAQLLPVSRSSHSLLLRDA